MTAFAAPKGVPEYYPPESAGFAHVRATLEPPPTAPATA